MNRFSPSASSLGLLKIAQQAKRGNSSKIACRLLRKPHTHFICARDRSEQVLTLQSKPDVMRERSRQIWTLLNNLEHQRVSFVIATVIVQARCGKELLLKQGGRVENLLSHQTPSKHDGLAPSQSPGQNVEPRDVPEAGKQFLPESSSTESNRCYRTCYT